MNQKQINMQHMRIATAVAKAYQGLEKNLITERVFKSKLACAQQAKVTLQIQQDRLLCKGY